MLARLTAEARVTNLILDEMVEALLEHHAHLDRPRLDRTRRLMCEAIPECLVEDYEHLIDGLELPDPDDRHVLAAAIRCEARTIVTANLPDFPETVLSEHGVVAKHPDAFVYEMVTEDPDRVAGVIHEQSSALRSPPQTVEDLLTRLERNGLKRTVQQLRDQT